MSSTVPGLIPDAAALRETIYGKRAPVRNDLVALFGLGAAAGDDSEFFALVGDVARDALAPDGSIDDLDADWLTEMCGDRSAAPGRAEFAALMSVVLWADPPRAELAAFAAREIERAILTGERAILGAKDGEPGCVTLGDVLALRALSADRPDRAMAEILFDIAHATATAHNHPAFDAFFAESLWAYLTGEIPAGARFDEFLAALDGAPPAPEAPAPLDGLDDSHYFAAAQASHRCETAALLLTGGAKWALAHLSRGALSPAERRLIAALRAPAAAPSQSRAA